MPVRKDFNRHIDQEEALPLYVIVGTESVLRNEAVAALRAKVLTAAPDFNRDELVASETTGIRVVEAASTMPMMAPRRWVHLSDLHKLKASEQDPLLAYADAPSPTTTLCLSGEKIDKRMKLGKKLAKVAALFSMDPPRQRELPGWLRKRAERQGYAISPDAAALLADLVGTDIGAIDLGLDKLWTYAGGEGTIEYEHVDELIAPTRVHSIFELTDAIGRRDLAAASSLLANTMQSGEAALRVLAMIARQFRILARVKQLQGAPPGQIASQAGVAPFLVDQLVRQAGKYKEAELCAAIDATARADMRMKSTTLNHSVVLDRLLVEVMG